MRAKTLLLATATALSASLAFAQDTLTIGTEASYRPFAFVLPSGELSGFDIDITYALCEEMGVTCEISNQSFDGLIPALTVGKIDAIIASMFITPERLEAIDFAGPYYNAPGLFIAAAGSEIEISEDGLGRKTVGVQRGTTMATYIETKLPGVRVQFYDTLDAATLDLTSNRIDVIFADSVALEDFLASGDGESFEIVGEPVFDDELLGSGAGIGLRQGEDELKAKFDEALAAIIASGKYQEINDKYISVSILPEQ
ncbi:MAG: transporter substrate-binding domain-containing protein [Mangrovicoccus sp.]|nr:transporter substrate-binding domain-containing protein [Mangrovicoccus sp.]